MATDGSTERSGLATKLILGAALLLVLALPFLLRPAPEATAIEKASGSPLPEKKLILISPHWEGIKEEFGRAFSEHTAERFGHRTTLEWLDLGGTSDALRFIRSEFERSQEGVNIDLFFGGGVDPYLQLSRENLLHRCDLSPEALDAVPQSFAGIEVYDADQRWFGACFGGFGILYNKRVLELMDLPRPETWEDLGRPVYDTWVGSGDPRSSGSVHMVYEIILQAYGWERGWATIARMGGNIRNFARGGSAVPKDTALGEVACGMAIDVYAWRAIAEAGADRMGFILPQGITVVNPDGIAVLKGAPNRDLAERFVEFVLSDAGQKLWVLKKGAPGGPVKFPLDRLPVIPGFAARFGEDASITLDPFDYKGGFTYDSEKGSLRWTILNDLLGAAVIDTHEELIAAWRAVQHLPPDDPRMRAFVEPPLSEAELLAMARDQWSDEAFRASTRARWAAEAGARYRRVAEEQP